jgi:cytochrome c-type biogenesis protein CcmH
VTVDDDPLGAARARLLRLRTEHDAGRLDDARYEEARRAVEREIGERLLAGGRGAVASRPSLRLVGGLAVVVLVLAAIGYWQTGSPSLARGGAEATSTIAGAESPASAASAASGLQQIAAMVDQLAERMKAHPDEPEGWLMLARSYTVLGRFADALPAYRRATELQPKNAGLLADYADAVAATKGTASNPESIALIERALAVDPNHPKALALAGTVAYDRGDYAGAIADWQKIVDRLPPDSELAQQVQASIAEARERAGGSAQTVPAASVPPSVAAAPAAAARPAASAVATRAQGSVSGTVTLDPALKVQAAPGDAVFVFARASTGSRMPLAVLRAKVADLPLAFKLDDSMAMAPGMTISSAKNLTVGARISKTGNALPQAGDLAGETTGVAPGAKNVAIRIGAVVGRP